MSARRAAAAEECQPCYQYLKRREIVITVAILMRCTLDDSPIAMFDRYMAGVHARHPAGLTLETDQPVAA